MDVCVRVRVRARLKKLVCDQRNGQNGEYAMRTCMGLSTQSCASSFRTEYGWKRMCEQTKKKLEIGGFSVLFLFRLVLI